MKSPREALEKKRDKGSANDTEIFGGPGKERSKQMRLRIKQCISVYPGVMPRKKQTKKE